MYADYVQTGKSFVIGLHAEGIYTYLIMLENYFKNQKNSVHLHSMFKQIASEIIHLFFYSMV